MNKYLIVNADDFGYNAEQNEAILDLAEKDLITSTSVLPVAPKAAECDLLSKFNISVGVHFTINSDEKSRKWVSLTGAKSLGAENGLPVRQSELTFKAKRKEVLNELLEQYDFVNSRVSVDHADNHCGTLYGINMRRFYLDAYTVCEKYALPYRFPETDGFLVRQTGVKMPKIVRSLQKMIVDNGKAKNVKMLTDLVSNPYSMSRIGDYETLRRYYLDIVEQLKDGVTEMFLHPAKPNEKMGAEWEKRVFEYELLKSGDILQKAEDCGVKVVNWKIFNEI